MSCFSSVGACWPSVKKSGYQWDSTVSQHSMSLARGASHDPGTIIQLELCRPLRLQTLGSRTSDAISSRKGLVPHDVLCAACATFSQNEAKFPQRRKPRIQRSLSEVKVCAQDQCPLCQVVLHIVTQTLDYRGGTSEISLTAISLISVSKRLFITVRGIPPVPAAATKVLRPRVHEIRAIAHLRLHSGKLRLSLPCDWDRESGSGEC